LELKTLIITDIDTVGDDGKKCSVSIGTTTSNNCIKGWFVSEKNISPTQLLAKDEAAKTKDYLHIAYQVPEAGANTTECGRSFEEAFMRANPTLFNTTDFYQEAKRVGKYKPDFALKYATGEDAWVVPKYIKDGLEWLAGNPSDQVIGEVIVPEVPVAEAESPDDAGE
jgi:putative ATP-dependent endonuclease of the OLD family